MLLPKETNFFFSCGRHTYQLDGTPKLKNPTKTATAVWEFDLSDMSCTYSKSLGGKVTNVCKDTWEVRA